MTPPSCGGPTGRFPPPRRLPPPPVLPPPRPSRPPPRRRTPAHADQPHPQETDLSTRAVIASPTSTGYAGMYVHFDGYPDSKLPLLLAAHQNRFAGDLEAMARHLIDEVHVGWERLGTRASIAPELE
ncbi:hypothetical protein ACIQH7_09985 [Streptomyces anulatus]|uniref:hypothetical protein n=1 Tax=Streptomyces sp. NPDC088719 TaxID=3365872 RepID=UPI0038007C68